MSYDIVVNFLKLVGSLVFFLYGMKMMSEALQKVAGSRIRKILAAMTSNRFLGVLTGMLVTAIIQSSSATTVMVVSFVNAGLLSLSESITVIMGANIGTTVTAWLISLVGFKIDIGALTLPLIAISFPFIFSSHGTRKSWGEFIMGFSLLFMGLSMLQQNVPQIESDPTLFASLENLTQWGFGSILIFLAIGTLLTVVIQSSSATMALTLILCHNGLITYELAAAMVLGENIGTTITANIAAMVANTTAKRAAFAHTLFNLVGVIWILILFHPVTKLIAITTGLTDSNQANLLIALSLFHSFFNIFNTLIQVWFVKYIEKIVVYIIPKKGDEDEEFGLKYIYTGMLSTAELSILQARKEIIEYAQKSRKMFNQTKKQFAETDEKKLKRISEKIYKNEVAMDEFEADIANYLTKISEGELSIQGTRRVRALLKISDNIESLADDSFNISQALWRKHKKKIVFTEEQHSDIIAMFKLVDKAFDLTIEALADLDHDRSDLTDINLAEANINNLRDELKQKNSDSLEKNLYSYQSSVVMMDLINICESLGDHLINVYEALAQKKVELIGKAN